MATDDRIREKLKDGPVSSQDLRFGNAFTRYNGFTAYEIVVHELAIKELESVRASDRRRILADIRDQLVDQPSVKDIV